MNISFYRLFLKPSVDCRVVVAAHSESPCGQHTAVLDVGLSTLLVQDIEQYAVFSLARNNHHVLEVLGSGADERDAADVDLLDDVGL